MSLSFYGKSLVGEAVRQISKRTFCRTTAVMASSSGTGTKYTDYVKFLELVGNLKHVKRTGWVMRNVQDPESVAGHMYRMSVATFLLDENLVSLDRIRCMEIALVHDLAESLVGDITPFCGVSREDKHSRELSAMEDIAKLAGPSAAKLMALYHEYEQGQTPEAKFVKDLDKLDMIMQAFEYEKRENNLRLQEFFDNTKGKFQHAFVQKLVDEIYAQRKQYAEELAGKSGEGSDKQKS